MDLILKNDFSQPPVFYDPETKMPFWINLAPCTHQDVIDRYHAIRGKLKCYRKYSCDDAIILVGTDLEKDFIFKIYIGSSDQIGVFFFFPKKTVFKTFPVDQFDLDPNGLRCDISHVE